MKPPVLLISMLIALCLTSCAGRQQMWYREGGSQRQYDIDARECEIIARQQALANSATGNRYDPVDYADLFSRCIMAKGWRTTPAATADIQSEPTPPSGTLQGNLLTAFGHTLTLPRGSRLISTERRAFGPTSMESFLFQIKDTFINITLQASDTASFTSIDYPVTAPRQLYESGHGDTLRWAAFWIPSTGSDWVMGLGAFLPVSKNRRCILAVTAPMPPPATQPPQGLHLAANQQEAMETFLNRHLPWLKAQAPQPGRLDRMFRALGKAVKKF